MPMKTATYSKIISPEDYNRIITFEHLYISASDRVIKELIETYKPTDRTAEVVEIGCGPARILPLIAQISDIHLTGIDHDSEFVRYAQSEISSLGDDVHVIQSDFISYIHPVKVDVFYSQGVHHHIGKGEPTKVYLSAVVSQLTKDGVYIVSDEFLPEYKDEKDRKLKAVIWYSHVIASAKRIGQEYLAQEEAKTLLDDLYEVEKAGNELKSHEQIELVLRHCTTIDDFARSGEIKLANEKAARFLDELSLLENRNISGDNTIDLSRGDYKISDSIFRKEMNQAGLEVIERRTIGPVDTIGGMAVYVTKPKL